VTEKPKRRILMFEPCVFQLLEKKGTVSSLYRPGRDLGPEYLEQLHYIFPFDVEEKVRSVHPRVTVHSFNKGSSYVWNAVRVVRYCVDFIRREKIDLIVTVDPYAGGLIARIVAKLTGLPLIAEVMGEYDVIYRETGKMINPALKFRWIENAVCNLVMRASHAVIGYMEVYRQFAINHGAVPAKTYTSYFSMQEYHFAPVGERGRAAKNFKRNPSDKLVAYVGRVDRRKYADHLLDVYERVARARADVTCLHVGDGPDREWIENEIRTRGLEGRVAVTGFLPNEEVWKLYGEVDVFAAILAGSSLAEAGAAECAIVAYDTDWHGEFLENGKAGLLAPFKDTAGFARMILELLDDEPRRKALGRAAREVALKRHSPDVLCRTFAFLYEKCINQKDHYIGIGEVGSIR
jgi:glycosyltransferase involved in cell wall biosynthesis